MTAEQIALYAFLALAAAWAVRRKLRARSVIRYDAAQLAERIGAADRPVLLDVRTDGERRGGSLPGSLHIPLHELSRRSEELTKHRAREIVVFCATGSRSLTAAVRLRDRGFNAAHLEGGLSAWRLSQRS